jgi:hypothetical protein
MIMNPFLFIGTSFMGCLGIGILWGATPQLMDEFDSESKNPAHINKASLVPLWQSPGIFIDEKAPYKISEEDLKKANKHGLKHLLSLGRGAEITLQTNIEDLTALDLFELSIAVESLNEKELRLFILNWLLQSFILGYEPALDRIHFYADSKDIRNPIAQNILGLIYGIGINVNEDSDKSLYYFLEASHSGLDQALINLLILLTTNNIQTPANFLLKLIKNGKRGDREAVYTLALLDGGRPQTESCFSKAVVALPSAATTYVNPTLEASIVSTQKINKLNKYESSPSKIPILNDETETLYSSEIKSPHHSMEVLRQENIPTLESDNPVSLIAANGCPQHRLTFTCLAPWVSSCLRSYKGELDVVEGTWHTYSDYIRLWRRSRILEDPAMCSLHLVSWTPESKNLMYILAHLQYYRNLTILNLITLDGSKMGDAGVIALGKTIQNLTKLKRLLLDFSSNRITNAGAQALGACLSELINLQSLTLIVSENEIEDEGIRAIGRGLSCLTDLINLELSFYSNNARNVSELVLTSNLQQLKSLEMELALGHVSRDVGINLGESINRLRSLTSLTISFEYEHIPKNITEILESFFERLNNIEKLTLVFRDCIIDLNQLKLFVESFKGLVKLSRLTSLTISIRSRIGDSGVQNLGQQLQELKQLSILRISVTDPTLGANVMSLLRSDLNGLTNLTGLYFNGRPLISN